MLDQTNKLNANASPRLPDIHHRVLRKPKSEIIKAEAKMCNLSSKTAAVPENFQVSDVTHRYGRDSGGAS